MVRTGAGAAHARGAAAPAQEPELSLAGPSHGSVAAPRRRRDSVPSVRKPSGPWEAATEPAGTDPVDPEDGPTLQVFVPSQGPARVLGNTDDDLVETTKQPLPRFEELTGSGFYETITKPRRWEQEELDEASTLRRSERDELDEAATLRRPPGLPPLPLPPPPRPWAAPEPPLKTDPFPLLPPPKSEPFP